MGISLFEDNMNCETILSDKCASNWLKEAVRAQGSRDPVDSVADAEAFLAAMKDRWARAHGATG